MDYSANGASVYSNRLSCEHKRPRKHKGKLSGTEKAKVKTRQTVKRSGESGHSLKVYRMTAIANAVVEHKRNIRPASKSDLVGLQHHFNFRFI